MLSKLQWNMMVYQIVIVILFIGTSVISTYAHIQSAIAISERLVHPTHVYYWLQSDFILIQTGNNILFLGGFAAALAGAVIPKRPVNGWGRLFGHPMVISFEFLLIAIGIGYLCGELWVPAEDVTISGSLFEHSLFMLLGTYLYLSFWTLFSNGISLTLSNSAMGAFLAVGVQVIEHYVILRYMPQLTAYFPTSLSRQLVVLQFPFFLEGTWAQKVDTAVFASSPMVVDERYRPLDLGVVRWGGTLVWFLLISYVYPVYKRFVAKQVKEVV